MSKPKTLATPQTIVWTFFSALKRQISRIDPGYRDAEQDYAICLFLSVNVVECFMNVYFRVLVSTQGYTNFESELLSDIKKRISLDKKLKTWPKNYLGKPLDFGRFEVQSFIKLKDQRNALMHFVSSHESLDLPDSLTVHGLADMSALKTLTHEQVKRYPRIIRVFAYEIFRAQGVEERNLANNFHRWFGEPDL